MNLYAETKKERCPEKLLNISTAWLNARYVMTIIMTIWYCTVVLYFLHSAVNLAVQYETHKRGQIHGVLFLSSSLHALV